MIYKKEKLILFVVTGFLLSFSIASAKNFTIFNTANVNQPYFSVNGTTGNVGIGTTAPGGQLHVNIGAVGTKGFIIQRATNQTANLMEWQDSNNTPLGFINNIGALQVGSTGWDNNYTGGQIIIGGYRNSNTSVSLLQLIRGGKSAAAYPGGASFNIASYGPDGVDNQVTRLDITLKNQSGDNLTTILPVMSLQSGGNVGIGTSIPNDKLSIGNSGVAPVGSLATGHNYTMTYLSSDPYALINYGTMMTLLNAATSSSALFGGTIGGNIWNLNSGNVGIGTTVPNAKLAIGSPAGTSLLGGPEVFWPTPQVNISVSNSTVGPSGADIGINLSNTSATYGAYSPLIAFSQLSNSTSYNSTYAAIGGVSTAQGGDTNWVSGALTFLTTNNGVSGPTEKMRIDNAGNVGIGTTNPQTNLHVAGNEGIYSSGGTSAGSPVAASLYLGDSNFMTAGYYNSAPGLSAVFDSAQNVSAALAFYTYTGAVGSRTERLRITSSGNIGIGTTAPLDTLSIGMGGVAAPAGSSGTGHNNTMTYVASDQYALINYGTMMTLLNAATTTNALWNGTKNGNIWNGDAGVGNVGIGTTNPNISGATARVGIVQTDGATGIALGNTSGVGRFALNGENDGSWSMYDYAAGSWSKGLVQKNGNVGIGTTNPGAKLDVNGNFYLTGTSESRLLSPTIRIGDPTGSQQQGDIMFGGPANTDFTVSYTRTGQAIWKQKFVNQTMEWQNNAGNTVFFANNSGNVGIGTTAPNDKLSIGNSGVAPVGSLATGHNYTMTYLSSDPYALTNYGTVMSLINSATSSSALFGGTIGGNIWNLNSGNVGIGTTNPSQGKLDVSGGDVHIGAGYKFYIGDESTMSAGGGHFTYSATNNLITIEGIKQGVAFSNISLAPNGGNIGIGTTDPRAIFHSAKDVVWTTFTNVPGQIFAGGATDLAKRLVLGYDTTSDFGFIQSTHVGDDFKNLALNPAGGNVGIGTTAPGNKLQINATTAAASSPLLRLSGGSTGFSGGNDVGTAYSIIFDGTSYSNGTGIVQRDGAKIEMAKENTWNESAGGVGVRGALLFYTGSGSVAAPTLTEKLRITSGGNVGIGTTAPLDTFSIGMGGVAAPAGSSGTGHNNTMTYVASDQYALINYGTMMTLLNAATTTNALWNGTKNGNIWNGDAGVGSVGIGTTAPTSPLHISKNLNTAAENWIIRLQNNNSEATTPTAGILFAVGDQQSQKAGILFRRTGSYGVGDLFFLNDNNVDSTFPTVSSSAVMTLKRGGNVGIGTTNPIVKLDVAGVGSTLAITNTDVLAIDRGGNLQFKGNWSTGNPAAVFASILGAKATAQDGAAYGYLSFSTFGSAPTNGVNERMRIDTAGNVGIGTTNPLQTLDVSGNIRLTGSGYNNGLEFYDSNTAANGPAVIAKVGANNLVNHGSGGLMFYTALNNSLTEKMRIDTAGNVGIGTTAPDYKLHVTGTIASVQANSDVSVIGLNLVHRSNTLKSGNVIQFNAPNYSTDQSVSKIIGWNNPSATDNSQLEFQTYGGGAFHSMYMDGAGNLGIGTTAPLDTFSIGTGGVAAPAGSSGTGHNNTMTYLSTDNYALVNYGTVKTLIASTTSNGLWGGTLNGNIWNGTAGAGNVGIGTTAPGSKLDITANTTNALVNINQQHGWSGSEWALYVNGYSYLNGFRINGADGQRGLFLNSGQLGFAVGDTSPITFSQSNATEIMRIHTNGNVGIGTTNPLAPLQVQKNQARTLFTGAARGVLHLIGNSQTPASNEVTAITFEDYSAGAQSIIGSQLTNNGTNLFFGTSNSYASGVTNTALFIRYDGNVGIRTTAPQAPLQVNGAVGIYNGASGDVGGISISPTNTDTIISNNSPGSYGNYGMRFRVMSSAPAYVDALYLQGGTGKVGIGTTAPNDALSIGTGGVAAPAGSSGTGHNNTMTYVSTDDYALVNYGTVKTLMNGATGLWGGTKNGNIWNGDAGAGNVGIGTTAPTTEKLVVAGGGLDLASAANSPGNNNGLGLSFESYGGRLQSYQSKPLILNPLGNNVGIGTTNPLSNLDIGGANPGTFSISSGGSIDLKLRGGSDYNAIDSQRTNDLNFQINSVSKMTLQGATGKVGIGTTAPNDTLSIGMGGVAAPAGSSGTGHNNTMTYVSSDQYALVNYGTMLSSIMNIGNTAAVVSGGDLNMGGHNILNVNKLTVLTIDPLYNLKGINYSTYAPSISGGVKEECIGKVILNTRNQNNEYEKIIDFSSEPKGSDLWVWRQVVDYSFQNVEVLITPYGQFANTYYLIENNKLIFRSDKPITLSYRLIGNRFDWRKWPTKALDQTEKGIVVD